MSGSNSKGLPSEQNYSLLINVRLDFLKMFQYQTPCCLSWKDVSQLTDGDFEGSCYDLLQSLLLLTVVVLFENWSWAKSRLQQL
jgi:hypothetical protein